MNSKERVKSFREYLSNNEGLFVQVSFSRPVKVKEESKIFLERALIRDYNLIGKIKSLKGNHLKIILNGEKTITIGLKIIKNAYLLRNPYSQKLKYKLYYNGN